MSEPQKLCIFGTRTFFENPEASRIIDQELQDSRPEMIITAGDADGVCKLAILKARQHSIPCEIHFLNPKYAQGMYDHRSMDILKRASRVLFIHDGESQGTKTRLNRLKNWACLTNII